MKQEKNYTAWSSVLCILRHRIIKTKNVMGRACSRHGGDEIITEVLLEILKIPLMRPGNNTEIHRKETVLEYVNWTCLACDMDWRY